jgi:hypothetical protein
MNIKSGKHDHEFYGTDRFTLSGVPKINPYLLIPWRKIVLEELIVTQLAMKFPAFYGTIRFNIVFTRARHWSLS